MLHAHFNILLKIFFKFQESYHGRIPNLILTRNKWLIQLCAQCPHSLWTTQLHNNQLLAQTIGHKNWSCSLFPKGNLFIYYVSKRKQFESYRQSFPGKMTWPPRSLVLLIWKVHYYLKESLLSKYHSWEQDKMFSFL